MNTIKECFETILKGSKEESRLAARKVRKLLYSSRGNRDEFIDIKNLINSARRGSIRYPLDRILIRNII